MRRTFFLFQSFCCHHAQQREQKIKKKSCEKKDILDCSYCCCCCSCIARRTRSGGPTTTNGRKHRRSCYWMILWIKRNTFRTLLCCTKFRALNPNSSKSSLFLQERRQREEGKEASKEAKHLSHHHGFDCRRRFPAHFARFKHERRWTREGT